MGHAAVFESIAHHSRPGNARHLLLFDPGARLSKKRVVDFPLCHWILLGAGHFSFADL